MSKRRAALEVEFAPVSYDTAHLDAIEGHISDYEYAPQLPAVRTPQTLVLPARNEGGRSAPLQGAYAVSHTIDAPLSATQHIEMRTSATDRAKGFLIASVPLYMAFALGVLLLSVAFAGVPFWSFWGLVIFWFSFVLAWVWGYRETLTKSAEGIAHFEAKEKWAIIAEEQRRRWDHYDRIIGEKNRGRK